MMGSASGTDRDGGQSRAEARGAALAHSADACEGTGSGPSSTRSCWQRFVYCKHCAGCSLAVTHCTVLVSSFSSGFCSNQTEREK